MAAAVSILSPVSTHTLMPAFCSASMVSAAFSCSLGGGHDTPSSANQANQAGEVQGLGVCYPVLIFTPKLKSTLVLTCDLL